MYIRTVFRAAEPHSLEIHFFPLEFRIPLDKTWVRPWTIGGLIQTTQKRVEHTLMVYPARMRLKSPLTGQTTGI
jgi:hypothetical protein